VAAVLVAAGLILVSAGVLVWLGVPLGRLPGDLVLRRGGFTLYLPIITSLLASLVLALAAWLIRR
jgi:hypothetical protein